MERRLWSQVVAVASELPANVVAVWSQSGLSDSASNLVAGPLTSSLGGAPRGIRTPNRQIRSLVDHRELRPDSLALDQRVRLQAQRPQLRVLTQRLGPGAPVFACLVARLRDQRFGLLAER